MPRLILTDLPTDTESLRRHSGLPPGWIHDRWSRRCPLPPASKPGSAWGDGAAPLVPPRGRPTTTSLGADDPKWLCPNTPYLLGPQVNASDLILMESLAPPGIASPLTCMSLAYGGDTTLALADIVHELRADAPDAMTMAAASADVFHGRIERFSQAVERSQRSILAYRSATRTGGPTTAAREQLMQANRDLNQRFQAELRSAHSRMSARYRTLTSVDEDAVTDKIRYTRKVAKLDVATRFEADRLVGLARGAKYFGNGIAAIDFGSRVSEIYGEYERGGDWGRRMFVESASFGMSAIVGSGIASAGLAALDIFLVATPAGWILLVAGGAVALASAIASQQVDRIFHAKLGRTYDLIMNWLSRL